MNKQIYKSTNIQMRGFSLVELLIYLALMSVFLVVLLDIFTTTLSTKLSSESSSGISQDASYILAKLSYDINNADSVITPALGATGTTLQVVNAGTTSTYSILGGNLVKTSGGISISLNGTDTQTDSITFKNIGNAGGKPTIQVVYTVRSRIVLNGGVKDSTSVSTTVGLR